MIIIKNYPLDPNKIANNYSEESIERKILNKMALSDEQYNYDSLKTLIFEVQLRKHIVNVAKDLNTSNLSFAVFDKSRCNSEYWIRTNNGGFLLKENSIPSIAINDIFINGKNYATECSTAMMIIYYKALLNIFKDKLFNETFTKIYLMDWKVSEPLLKEVTKLKQTNDSLLGDRKYFVNPDVNPFSPEWQGENVIVLPNSLYYGHGIGISTSTKIIYELNKNRKIDSTKSAYLMNSVGRPNFKNLSNIYYSKKETLDTITWNQFPESIV